MIFEQLQIGTMQNFTYIVGDEASKDALVVDPHGDAPGLVERARAKGVRIRYIVNTHTHWDHVAGNEELKALTGAKIITHSSGKIVRDRGVEDKERIHLGDLVIEVLHTPGHTEDSICLLVENRLMTGDTLFVGDCGRTDLPGGDSGKLYESLQTVLGELEDDVVIYPGHDYGATPFSSLGRERKENLAFSPRSKEEFVHFMESP